MRNVALYGGGKPARFEVLERGHSRRVWLQLRIWGHNYTSIFSFLKDVPICILEVDTNNTSNEVGVKLGALYTAQDTTTIRWSGARLALLFLTANLKKLQSGNPFSFLTMTLLHQIVFQSSMSSSSPFPHQRYDGPMCVLLLFAIYASKVYSSWCLLELCELQLHMNVNTLGFCTECVELHFVCSWERIVLCGQFLLFFYRHGALTSSFCPQLLLWLYLWNVFTLEQVFIRAAMHINFVLKSKAVAIPKGLHVHKSRVYVSLLQTIYYLVFCVHIHFQVI